MKRNVALITIVALIILFGAAIIYNFSKTAKTEIVENKPSIQELISMKNEYQHEYNFIDSEIKAIILLENISVQLGEKKTPNYNKAIEKTIRQELLKDSIEILNVMINNYKF